MSESEDSSEVTKTKAETESSPEIRSETRARLEFVDQFVQGRYRDSLPPEGIDPEDTFSGPVFDENDENVSEEEIRFVRDKLEGLLGGVLEEVPVKARYVSSDGVTRFVIYEPSFGDGWRFSRWQNEGEKPSYIFWMDEYYDQQIEEAGFEEVTSETS